MLIVLAGFNLSNKNSNQMRKMYSTYKRINKQNVKINDLICFGYKPGRVCDSVGGSQISSKVMAQHNHTFQAQFLPPLFDGLHKLELSLLGISAEVRSAALAKTQQVEGVNGPLLRERVHVQGPESNTTPKSMQQHQRGFIFHWSLKYQR